MANITICLREIIIIINNMDEILKKCASCKEEKLLSEFYPDKKYKYCVSSICKKCSSNKSLKYYHENKIQNQKKYNTRIAKLRKENPEKYRMTVRLSVYKKLGLIITKEEYEELCKKQNYKCAICNGEAKGFKKNLCLDHDHNTLQIRGLLCDKCNKALGHFQDNIDIITNALNYLKKYKN